MSRRAALLLIPLVLLASACSRVEPIEPGAAREGYLPLVTELKQAIDGTDFSPRKDWQDTTEETAKGSRGCETVLTASGNQVFAGRGAPINTFFDAVNPVLARHGFAEQTRSVETASRQFRLESKDSRGALVAIELAGSPVITVTVPAPASSCS